MPALAQSNQAQPPTQQGNDQSSQRNDQGRSKHQDVTAAEFVQKAATGNMFEIRSSQLAASRSENGSIREYARTLIADHRKMGQELGAAAGDATLPTELDQQREQMLTRLEQASGGQFDRRFIRMQIRAHQEAVSLYRNYTNRSERSTDSGRQTQNATLHQYAAKYLPILQDHLQTARELREDLRQQSNRTAARQNQQSDEGQRNSRSWTVEQRAPQVTVRRQQPNISIQQQQPRITIRQAPPTVTIDQPPPEITVQMPRPDVNVAAQRPQVSVNVPRPQVRFNDESLQPRVRIQGPRESDEGQYEFQRARPNVDYRRTGEPKVVYRNQNQEPKVQYLGADGSRLDSATQGREQQTTQSRNGSETRNTDSRNSDDWVRHAQRMTQDDDTQETTGVGQPDRQTDGTSTPERSRVRAEAVQCRRRTPRCALGQSV